MPFGFGRFTSLADINAFVQRVPVYGELPAIPFHDVLATRGREALLVELSGTREGLREGIDAFRNTVIGADAYRQKYKLPVVAPQDQQRRVQVAPVESAARYLANSLHFKYATARGTELAMLAASLGRGDPEEQRGHLGSARWNDAVITMVLGPLSWHMKKRDMPSYTYLFDRCISVTFELFEKSELRFEFTSMDGAARSTISSCPCGCMSGRRVDLMTVDYSDEWKIGLF